MLCIVLPNKAGNPLKSLWLTVNLLDGTAAIARSFSGVRYMLQPDLGIARARNLAVTAATGEFIAFLDADDMWLPHKLAVQLAFMLARPQLMYTTTLLNLFYEPGCSPRPGYREEGFTTGIEGRFPGTMLARREVFQHVGPFDPDFAVAFEVDWFARAQDAGVPSALIEEVLLRKRIHDHNNSIQREQFRREWFVVMRRSLTRKRASIAITAEPQSH